MKTTLVVTSLALVFACSPAMARGGGGAFGAGLLGGVVGGVVGGAVGSALAQPQLPPPTFYAPPPVVYGAPPIIVERHVYVTPSYVAPAPVYVAPVQRVAAHPWPGPGFACYEPEPNGVNRTICSSEDLSGAMLALNQAVQAGIQQAAYNGAALRAEYASFMQTMRSQCAPYAVQAQGDCITGMLAPERDAMANRLSGIYAAEASRPIGLHIALQQRLHAMGLMPGGADGVYGDGTRRAIMMWQGRNGRPTTGVISDEEVAMLMPETQSGTIQVYVAPPKSALPPVAPAAPPAALAVQQASVTTALPTLAATASADPLGGLHEGAPYALARGGLFKAGWQTQFFKTDGLSDGDRETRQYFTDHHINEVLDCSSSGCKMQLHNADGRLLYVYTQVGSHASDAYHGAGPSVIAYCLDVDDITCPAPSPASGAVLTAGREGVK